MSTASLGYGMQRLKTLGLDKNISYYVGDLELLDETPPTAFGAGFDLITGIIFIYIYSALHSPKNDLFFLLLFFFLFICLFVWVFF